MKNPLISIGLPTYNGSLRIKPAIESVLNQEYTHWELIISDNASEDDTQIICEQFRRQDQRIKYYRQTINLGAVANFQAVLHKANGAYFMWLGDDDALSCNYIKECAEFLMAHQDYVLVGGKAEYYLHDNTFLYQGAIIDLEQELATDRVLSYYSQVSDNGIFYGLIRPQELKKI
ncbi:MAG TPA: glycosyltransferase family 2 protein, partial [Allocoleopsis sp.]